MISMVIGIGMLVFGLVNFFRYLPISHSSTFWNKPFPFEHMVDVVPSDGHGTKFQMGYMPIDEAINDPYWLFWSLMLYAGIAVICFAFWRNRK